MRSLTLVPAAVLAVLLNLPAAFGGVDPSLLNLVMPEATTIAGVQVDQARSSSVGQYLLSKFHPDSGFDKLVETTGFDPRRDLQEVVMGSIGGRTGIAVGKGRFLPSKIAAAAMASGASVSNYKGFELITQSDKEQSVAFVNSTTVLMGTSSLVKAALDRSVAGSSLTGPLAQSARAASASRQIWFTSSMPPAGLLAGAGPKVGNLSQTNALQTIVQTSGGISFDAAGVTLTADAVTRSDQDAQGLADMLRFVASMIQMNRDKGDKPGQVASIMDSLTLSATGSTMHLRLVLPEQQMEQLLLPGEARRKTRAAQ